MSGAERVIEPRRPSQGARPAPGTGNGSNRDRSRLDGVDVLRGLAILFVLLNHVNMRLFLAKIPYTAGLPDRLVSTLVWSGQNGVQMFFAVSGFLITSTSIRRWGSLSRLDVGSFYALRFARIAPLLIVLLAVLCALHAAGLQDFMVSARTGGLGRALLAALTFNVNWLEAQRGYLPGSWDILWSLSVEEMFYLFFPPICRSVRGRWLVVVLGAFVVLGPFARTVLTHGNEVWHEYSYLGRMDAIAFGCLTALALSGRMLSRPVVRLLGGAGVAILIFSLCFSNRVAAWGLADTGLDMTLIAIGSCLVIAASAQGQWKAPRVLFPLTRLGQRSYEVYLTHMFVVFALFGIFRSSGARVGAVPLLFIAVILIAAVLGELVARFYSEPVNLRLRQRWRDGTQRALDTQPD
jgi:peptidoglycan/LPS O-acetylase OafA/YrhL